MPKTSRQLSLFAPSRRRIRPGRSRAMRTNTPHRTRPEHSRHHPVHVTLRAVRGLPSFRRERLLRLLRNIVRYPRYEGFQVVHYSIQHDHLHLLLEAPDKRQLSSGIRSFVIRLAKRLNKLLGRHGRVWGDRYHRVDLRSPRQVRNALVYVLANWKKHARVPPDAEIVDGWTTAAAFRGWNARLTWLPPPEPLHPPLTWLLASGWQRHGRLSFREGPGTFSAVPA